MHALRQDGKTLFFERNPVFEGCQGSVEEEVTLYFPDDVFNWADGEETPRVCVGVSNINPKWFKVFASERACKEADYRKVANGPPRIYHQWSDYLLKEAQKVLMPERAQECIAINLETGEYVVGKTPTSASEAFRKRWGNAPKFASHVDGSPLIKFHTPFRRVLRN